MRWGVGPGEFKLDILVANDCGDGFAPVPAPIPEPATMLLFGFGLITLGGVGLRKRLVR